MGNRCDSARREGRDGKEGSAMYMHEVVLNGEKNRRFGWNQGRRRE